MNDRRITKARTGATYTLSELQHVGSLGSKKQARVRRHCKRTFARACRRHGKVQITHAMETAR